MLPRSGVSILSCSTTFMPIASSHSMRSPHESPTVSSSVCTSVNGIHLMCLCFISSVSFSVIEPDVRLRGLAYSSSDSMQKRLKSSYEMTASPRITVWLFVFIVCGTPFIAVAICVTFVPIWPFPRVTIFVSFPSSYVTTSVIPSSFHEIQIGLPSAHFTSSAGCFVFASDRAEYSCASFPPLMLSSDTFVVGLSGRVIPVISSRCFSSSNFASHS